MGTDIHGVLQVRWSDEGGWFAECEIPDGRNYRLFAALAGVRNGYGFAGTPTHEPLVPIAEPRGLPDDFKMNDDGHTHGYRETDMGDHSFSWLTLDECESYDGWARTLDERGVLHRTEFEQWDGTSTPSGWSAGVSGPNVVMADATEDIYPEGWTHVRIKRSARTLGDACKSFMLWLPYARSLAGKGQGRIVFGFDS